MSLPRPRTLGLMSFTALIGFLGCDARPASDVKGDVRVTLKSGKGVKFKIGRASCRERV